MKSLIIISLWQIMTYSQIYEYTIPAKAEDNQSYSIVNDSSEVYLLSRTHPLRFMNDTCLEKYIVVNPPSGFESRQMPGTIHRQLTDVEAAQIIDASVLFQHRRPAGQVDDWEVNQRVDVDDVRIYNANYYTCLQPHITLQNWTPEITLGVLWTLNAQGYNWQVGVSYSVDDSVTYLGSSYYCLQAHVSQTAWNPIATLNVLWAQYQSGNNCPQWMQPTGAQDAYSTGDCVTFNGNCYESLINANVWSPSVYPAGWNQIECP